MSGPRLHTCSACGKQEAWGSSWLWFGSYKEMDDGDPIFKACSQACMDRRSEVQAKDRIATDIEAAKAEEQRLEQELERKRAWRIQMEALPPSTAAASI